MATKLAWIPLTPKNVQEAINIGIRIFGEADAPGINFAFKASVGILPDADLLTSDPYVESLKYFIVTKDGKPAGITGYYTIKDHAEDKWLGWMGILPEFRGQGLSTEMVNGSFEIDGEATSCHRIWTTNEPDYDAARILYRKMGFVEESYRPQATDAASMVIIYSKATDVQNAEVCSWQNSAYPIDCERRVIPFLNNKLGLSAAKGNQLNPPAFGK